MSSPARVHLGAFGSRQTAERNTCFWLIHLCAAFFCFTNSFFNSGDKNSVEAEVILTAGTDSWTRAFSCVPVDTTLDFTGFKKEKVNDGGADPTHCSL